MALFPRIPCCWASACRLDALARDLGGSRQREPFSYSFTGFFGASAVRDVGFPVAVFQRPAARIMNAERKIQ